MKNRKLDPKSTSRHAMLELAMQLSAGLKVLKLVRFWPDSVWFTSWEQTRKEKTLKRKLFRGTLKSEINLKKMKKAVDYTKSKWANRVDRAKSRFVAGAVAPECQTFGLTVCAALPWRLVSVLHAEPDGVLPERGCLLRSIVKPKHSSQNQTVLERRKWKVKFPKEKSK